MAISSTNSTRSRPVCRWVAEEAAGALWNLSMNDNLKDRIAAAGVLDALVGLLSRWPKDAEVVQVSFLALF